MGRSGAVATGAAAVLVAACGDAAPAATAAEPVVRDSAGITIVENHAPRWGDAEGWRVSPEPRVEIGMIDGPPHYQFDRIRGATLLSEGRIAAADMGSGEVRFFDADGVFMNAAGGSGRGPEEFRQILGLHRLDGDELLVLDLDRIVVLGRDGAFSHTVTPPLQQRLVGAFEDGTMLAAEWPRPAPGRSGRWVDSVTLHRLSPDGGDSFLVGRHPAMEFASGSLPMPSTVAFGARPALATASDRFFYGYSDRPQIDVFTPEGTPVRRVRWDLPARPVGEDDRAAYRHALAGQSGEGGGSVSPQLQAQRQRMADETVFAETIPDFGRIFVDRDGNLWVEEFQREHALPQTSFTGVHRNPTHWEVFDAEGRWLGAIELPPSFRPLDIGTDYVLGLHQDEFDVEYLRMYDLIKPEGR